MESKTIGVVGLGLMGASLCKALHACGHRILGTDTDAHVLGYAKLTDTIQEELTGDRIGECDFLFLATYPGAAVETLKQMAPKIRKDTIVCDLCGVKLAVCEPCFALADAYGFTFIGGHPMAGKQFSGIKYADEHLFRDATMILVPREKEDLFTVSRLSSLLRETGFRSVTITTADGSYGPKLDAAFGDGFLYAYQIPGMHKVTQAVGRVIRSGEDRGVALLIDTRYAQQSYRRLCPEHWMWKTGDIGEQLRRFWEADGTEQP